MSTAKKGFLRSAVYFLLSTVTIWFGGRFLTGVFLRAAHVAASGIVYDIVLIFSLLTVAILLLGLRNACFLIRDRRNRVVGARIRSRLTVSFLLVTLIPVVILGGVIAFMMSTGIKAVYRPEVEAALNRTVRMFRLQRRQERTRLITAARRIMAGRSGRFLIRNHKGVAGLLFVGRIKNSAALEGVLPGSVLKQLERRSGGPKLVPVHHRERITYLYTHPLPASIEFALVDPAGEAGATAAQVASSLSNYRLLRVLRDPLVAAFIYLSLFAWILSTLFVFLISLRISRSITAPLKDVGEATQKVAQGDLEYRVAYPRHDALGFLVDNFNRMTDELSRSRTKLYNAERIAAWQEVARRLAHEIKNPLTPIRLVAERILRQSKKERVDLLALVQSALPTILTEVHVMQELVDEFSAFAKMPTIHMQNLEANAFFEELVSSYISDGGGCLHFVRAEEPLPVSVDPAQMRRVISNLLQNSLRALCDREDAEILVRLRRVGGNALISVRDNGEGIPDDIRSTIFQPYFTTSEAGTGLGLAIVLKIVTEHRGSIWFRSAMGEGTTFYIELPLANGLRSI